MEQKDHTMIPARWADQTARAWYHQEATQQRAIPELQALLDGSQSAIEVAQAIATIYDPQILGHQFTKSVPRFWGLYCGAVREFGGIPEQAERLCDLLESISGLPDVAWTVSGKEVYWRDLPDFAIMFREYGFFEIFSDICESVRFTLLTTQCNY